MERKTAIREMFGLTGPILDPPQYAYERIEQAMEEYAAQSVALAKEAWDNERALYRSLINSVIDEVHSEYPRYANELINKLDSIDKQSLTTGE